MDDKNIDIAMEELYEKLIECDLALESYSEEYPATEGLNINIQDKVEKAQKEFRKASKELKLAIKNNDVDGFKKSIETCKSSLEVYEKEIEKLANESGIDHAVIAYLFGDVKTIVLNITGLFTVGGGIGVALVTIAQVRHLISIVNTIIDLINKYQKKEALTPRDFNIIVKGAVDNIKSLRKALDKIEAEGLVKMNTQKAQGNGNEVRESSSSFDFINNINIAVESMVDGNQYKVALEAMEDILDDMYLTQAMEGVNKDMNMALKELNHRYLEEYNAMTNCLERGDKNGAIEHLAGARKALQEVDTETKRVLSNGSTTWETIKSYGRFFATFATAISSIGIGIHHNKKSKNKDNHLGHAAIGGAAIGLGILGAATNAAQAILAILNAKNSKEDFTEADKKTKANLILREARAIIKSAYKHLDKIDEQIDALEDRE